MPAQGVTGYRDRMPYGLTHVTPAKKKKVKEKESVFDGERDLPE